MKIFYLTKICAFFAVLILLTGCSQKAKQRRIFIKANEALSAGAFDYAIDQYTYALQINPDFAEAYNNRGVAHIESGNPYDALLDYQEALNLNPDYHECRLNRAFAYEKIAQYRLALSELEKVMKIYPDSGFLHFYKGIVLTKSRDFTGAQTCFIRSIRQDGENVEVLVNLGTLKLFLGQLDSAELYVQKALLLNPREANAFNTLSQVKLAKGDLEGALYAINLALELVPQEAFFLNNRGLIYLEMNEAEVALADINKSIMLNPSNGWAYRNKGIYYLQNKQFDRAIELFERSLASGDFIDEVYFYTGLAWQDSGNLIKACEAWNLGASLGEARSKAMICK
jgi:tetratricopeptide (TPR) repeat protein